MRSTYAILVTVFMSLMAHEGVAQYSSRHLTQNQFSFWWDNDVFTMSDRYYSQGLSFQLVHGALEKNPINKALISLGDGASDYYALSLTQHVITPSTIKDSSLLVNDRPYAGLLYLSFERMSIDYKHKLQIKSGLDIGMRGPVSGAEEVQYYYHYLSDIAVPLGWHHQMSIYPMVNYNLALQKQLFDLPGYLALDAYGQLRVGTIYNDILAGAHLKFGKFDSYYNPIVKNNFELYGFAAMDLKYVVYNGTMQGEMQKRPNEYALNRTQIMPWVAQLKMGGAVRFKGYELNASWIGMTPEFKGGMHHTYTSIGMSFWF